jgi:hypothetical protein
MAQSESVETCAASIRGRRQRVYLEKVPRLFIDLQRGYGLELPPKRHERRCFAKIRNGAVDLSRNNLMPSFRFGEVPSQT